MNAKNVLTKIMHLLSKDEVELAFAKLKDGTIVESPTFDVGESLDVVSEDGTKTPAPDGEHELALKDSEGNETLIKVITKDGKIVERENVELEDTDKKEEEEEKKSELAEETEEAEPITEDEMKEDEVTEMGDMKKKIEEMAYRIEEMEKKMEEMGKHKMEEETKKEEDVKMEEEELPKLDGAPIDSITKMSEQKEIKFGKKVANTQDRFLSKLYK